MRENQKSSTQTDGAEGRRDQRLVTLSSEATTTGDYQMDNQVEALVEIAINRAMPTIKEMLKQEMLKRFEFTPTKRG